MDPWACKIARGQRLSRGRPPRRRESATDLRSVHLLGRLRLARATLTRRGRGDCRRRGEDGSFRPATRSPSGLGFALWHPRQRCRFRFTGSPTAPASGTRRPGPPGSRSSRRGPAREGGTAVRRAWRRAPLHFGEARFGEVPPSMQAWRFAVSDRGETAVFQYRKDACPFSSFEGFDRFGLWRGGHEEPAFPFPVRGKPARRPSDGRAASPRGTRDRSQTANCNPPWRGVKPV